jgi:parallel beta-helix repeat protein
MARSRVFAALTLGAAALGLHVAPAHAATPVHCGQVLTTSTVVANDLTNCHTVGLVIGGDGVTLDLNGHTIDGDSQSDFEGIQDKGYDNVTIRNGVVREFVEGIAVLHAQNIAVSDVTLLKHRHVGVFADSVNGMTVQHTSSSLIAFSGVFVTRSSRVDISDNVVRRSGAGVAVSETTASSITANRIARTGCIGIDVGNASTYNVIDTNTVTGAGCEAVVVADGSSHNAVTRNTTTGNDAGIGVAYANANTVSGNVVHDNHFVGLYLFAASDNRLDGNVLSGNGQGSEGGIHVLPDGGALARRNIVSRNTITDSVGDGILVDAGSPGTMLDRNVANQNSDDGIDVDEPRATLRANQANNNGDLGIEAVAGVTDAGGNTASGNGDARQCTHVAC